MEIIDCHAHLADKEFDQDVHEVISRAKENGVKSILLVTENKANFEKAFYLREKYPEIIKLCLGVHPIQVVGSRTLLDAYLHEETQETSRSVLWQDYEEAKDIIEANIDKIFGIGEVGLDFTPRFCPTEDCKDSQRKVLLEQVKLAIEHDLTVNVHSRSAGRPTIELLREAGVTRAHLHAFDGRSHYALQGAQYGYYFSIPPCVMRSEQKQKLVKDLPLDNLLIETDSPVLAAEKSERNEPSQSRIVVDFIAKTKGLDSETVARITTENAFKAYPRLSQL